MQVCTIRAIESAVAARSFEQVFDTDVQELVVLSTNESLGFGLDRGDASLYLDLLMVMQLRIRPLLAITLPQVRNRLVVNLESRRKLSNCSETGCSTCDCLRITARPSPHRTMVTSANFQTSSI